MQIRPACLFFLSPLLLPHTKERLFPTPCVLHTCEGTPDGKPDGSVSYTILDFKTDSPCEGHHGLELGNVTDGDIGRHETCDVLWIACCSCDPKCVGFLNKGRGGRHYVADLVSPS